MTDTVRAVVVVSTITGYSDGSRTSAKRAAWNGSLVVAKKNIKRNSKSMNASTKTKKIIVPAVHINGTAQTDLLGQIENAYSKVGEAIDALRMASPNGRDYYVYDNQATTEAADQHFDRMKRLQSVQDELEALANAIGFQEKYTTCETFY